MIFKLIHWHSCQPSWNGWDSSRILDIVLVASQLGQNMYSVPDLATLTLASTNLCPWNTIRSTNALGLLHCTLFLLYHLEELFNVQHTGSLVWWRQGKNFYKYSKNFSRPCNILYAFISMMELLWHLWKFSNLKKIKIKWLWFWLFVN